MRKNVQRAHLELTPYRQGIGFWKVYHRFESRALRQASNSPLKTLSTHLLSPSPHLSYEPCCFNELGDLKNLLLQSIVDIPVRSIQHENTRCRSSGCRCSDEG